MNIFLSEGFSEKCKHTELALNFIQKQNLFKKTSSLHYTQIGRP